MGSLIAVALVLGLLVYRRQTPMFVPSLVAYVFLLVAIYYGEAFAAAFPVVTQIPVLAWVWLLLLPSPKSQFK